MGWAQTADALMPDFDIGTRVEKDMKVYAVWRKTEIDLNASGNVKIKVFGELVIAFSKYDVAPGAMGAPEFTIPMGVLTEMDKAIIHS